MTDWQPIETAPKDGTPILVCGGRDECAEETTDKVAAILMLSPARVAWVRAGWLITLAECGCVSVRYKAPTHWQPLPLPPLT